MKIKPFPAKLRSILMKLWELQVGIWILQGDIMISMESANFLRVLDSQYFYTELIKMSNHEDEAIPFEIPIIFNRVMRTGSWERDPRWGYQFSKVLDSEYFEVESFLESISEVSALSYKNLMIFYEIMGVGSLYRYPTKYHGFSWYG